MNNKRYLNRIKNFFLKQKLNLYRTKNQLILSTFMFVGALGYFIYSTDDGSLIATNTSTNLIKDLSTIKIPGFMRNFVFSKYASKYGVNLQELEKPLNEYQTFSEFFTRKIKQRTQFKESMLNGKTICSPCDSQILNISKIEGDENLIIKDIKYSLSNFLFETQKHSQKVDINELKYESKNDLYQIIFYLHPGDYHRFHAPIKISFKSLRKVQGLPKPVKIQSLLKNGGSVYQKNARSIMHCSYYNPILHKNLYLCLGFIGALNVSDIVIKLQKQYEKGQQIGYFNLGSTIVMIIQSKGNPKWHKKVGDTIRYGETLCQFI